MDKNTVGALARAKRPGVRLRAVAREGVVIVTARCDGGEVSTRAPFLMLHEALLATLLAMREVRS